MSKLQYYFEQVKSKFDFFNLASYLSSLKPLMYILIFETLEESTIISMIQQLKDRIKGRRFYAVVNIENVLKGFSFLMKMKIDSLLFAVSSLWI